MSDSNRGGTPDHFGLVLAASTILLILGVLDHYKNDHDAERKEAAKGIRDVALSECVAKGNLIDGPICEAMVENAEAKQKPIFMI